MKVLNRMWQVMFIVFLFTTALSMPIAAQDEVAPNEPIITVQGPGVEAVGDDVSVNLVQIVIGLLTAFAAGGVVGIAGLAVFVDRIRNDKATVTSLELLANSYPSGTRDLLLNISKTVESVGELGKEVFDGVPISDKPDAPLAEATSV